jgi:methyltransferase-like protein/SAM-dependent methyltransferase
MLSSITPGGDMTEPLLYPSHPRPFTHPDNLSTMATLFGMNPAPSERCRVLELGCADGCNLVPMALFLPESKFVGIDIERAAIEQGQAIVSELGLTNLSLCHADIAGVSPEYGEFDYIVVAGIFSWVPPAIRERILEICREHLAPEGIAYISYNVYPGWHLRQMARDTMLYHLRGLDDPARRVQQGRALLKFLMDAQPESSLYHALLDRELQITDRKMETVLLDELGEINVPFYFHQFMELAGRYGMQYLSEAEFCAMCDQRYSPEVREKLCSIAGSLVAREQYLDFLSFRQFRQTLLCRANLRLRRQIDGASMRRFYFSAQLEDSGPLEKIVSAGEAEFADTHGAKLTMNSIASKAALHLLGKAWPLALSFDELLARVSSLMRSPACDGKVEDAAEELSELLFALFSSGIAHCSISAPRFTCDVSERPVASPLARLQAGRGRLVTNLTHRSVYMAEDLPLHLLRLLDGTRDHAALREEIAGFNGTIEPELRSGNALETILQGLARTCLLIA